LIQIKKSKLLISNTVEDLHIACMCSFMQSDTYMTRVYCVFGTFWSNFCQRMVSKYMYEGRFLRSINSIFSV